MIIEKLVEREWEGRRNHRRERFLLVSRLPLEKTIESFERKRLPAKVEAQLNMLLEGSFVERAENVLVFGNPGSGKSHILCALGHELILRGYRVLFRPYDLHVQELLGAKRDLTLTSMLKQFSKYDALIIDDIGYVQQSQEEMEALFSLLSYRYERKSVMLSSNLQFSELGEYLQGPNDHGDGDRPTGASLCDSGAKCNELPAGICEEAVKERDEGRFGRGARWLKFFSSSHGRN
jgi:DNA replication protein DnaC